MRERPILFSGPMVRALLDGSKTQTRRVIKDFMVLDWLHPDGFLPKHVADPDNGFSPYGYAGDRLWVRETFRIGEDLGQDWEPHMEQGDRFVIYDADASTEYVVPDDYHIPRNAKEVHNSEGTPEHWRSFGSIPSIFMPRWACRIVLEIVSVRVERLQDITDGDAMAEGVDASQYGKSHRYGFSRLWDKINGPDAWEANPWVWVVEFRVVEPAKNATAQSNIASQPVEGE